MDNAPQPPSTAPGADLTGRVLGDFHILRCLGRGGMGQVYLAEQSTLKRNVAIKVLKPELAADPLSLKRFQAEAEAVARVSHANIVGVYAVHDHDGLQYMVLEYVDGWNLRQYVERKGPPELGFAFSIMRQVAAALQRAAEAGLIHRDIKPENILLTRKGEAKVADFGLSRCLETTAGQSLTESGLTVGTPMYMSPEQVQGEPLDPRSDMYSFGATCYFMLSGRAPFQGQTAFQVALHHVQSDPQPLREIRPDLPAELCILVERMMAKRREDRYATPREVFRELARIRESLSGTLRLSRSKTVAVVPKTGPTSLAAELLGAGWPQLRWLALAAGVAAIVAGAFIGWKSGHLAAPEQAVAASSSEEPSSERVDSFSLEEQRLLRDVDRTALGNDGKKLALADDPSEGVRHGVDVRLRLALLYLDEWRLDDAGRFFHEQTGSAVPAYQSFGRLGEAVVLSFRDQAAASNERFEALFGEIKAVRQARVRAMLVNRNRRFHLMIVEALDRNVLNKIKLTPELEELRKPQPYTPSALAGQRKSGSSKGP
jgi:serine/threonine-protein kinase